MDLAAQIERYLAELKRRNMSAHTVRAYGSDLGQFRGFLAESAEPSEIDRLVIRDWLRTLWERRLDAVSIRRKLAAVRSFFDFLVRDGMIALNPARLVDTPRAAERLPRAPTPGETETLISETCSRIQKLHTVLG